MVAFDRSALKLMRDTAERYHRNLKQPVNRGTLAYLNDRGINGELQARYLLGVCDDIRQGWLTIPYQRPDGVIWFNYRNPTPGAKPKYIAAGEKHLYNTVVMDQADATGEIAITEGELDAIVSTELCGVPAVGIPGATQWAGNPHWRELFTGYQRVWLLADPDDAGLSLASALLESLPAARLVRLPDDVNETYLKHGGIKEFMK